MLKLALTPNISSITSDIIFEEIQASALRMLKDQLFEKMNAKAECWKNAVSGISDEIRLLANAPEKPWRN